jgi:tetratricopeptide (TPR) repeat protein
MSNSVRIVLYLVISAALITFTSLLYSSYRRVNAPVVAPANPDGTDASDTVVRAPSRGMGQLMTYGALSFASLVGLGLLIGRDAAKFAAQRAEDFILSDDGEGLRSPEYEEAEQVWANGQFLEAIQLMRDYSKKNPRELHVALRIAEIYEKDLNNYLAAALEYEEVIKHKLPPERWGWAAIHLANLYSGKLNRPEQAVELLRRIVNEYGSTAAARKARERLAVEGQEPTPSTDDPSDSNLPPGFSLKK